MRRKKKNQSNDGGRIKRGHRERRQQVSDARYDFSATINVKTTRAYSYLFSFLYSPFFFLSLHDAICRYRFVCALLTGFYEPRSIPSANAFMEKKARQPYIFTADSVTSGLYAPAHHAPDLQGNYHALIRESTARETIRFTMSTPFCAVCIKLYIILTREKNASKVGVNCRNC